MITVAILINGEPILTRSAVNTGKTNGHGETVYEVDTGTRVYHAREDGAVALAHKLLDTIHDFGAEPRGVRKRKKK